MIQLLLVQERVRPACWLPSPPPATLTVLRAVFPDLQTETTRPPVGEGLLVRPLTSNRIEGLAGLGENTERLFRQRLGDPCASGVETMGLRVYVYSVVLRTSAGNTTLLVSQCPDNLSRAAYDRMAFDAVTALQPYEWLLGKILDCDVVVEEKEVDEEVVHKTLVNKLVAGKALTAEETALVKRLLTERFSLVGTDWEASNSVHKGIALALFLKKGTQTNDLLQRTRSY